MSVIFNTVDVVKTKENFHYVMWDVEVVYPANPIEPPPAPEDSPDNYYYVIYWSNDPASGFHSIKDDEGNDIQIDGASGPLEYSVKHYRKHFNFNIKYYYCVVAYHKTEPETAYKSGVVYQGQYKDGVHIQIKHAEDTLYSMYYGEPCLIIKRKSYGETCPNCWSKERQQRTKSNCSVCQNTGKTYGYYQPIPMQISFDSDPVKSDVQKDYEVVTDTKRGRLSNYPMVRPRDLIVNLDDNKRYTITHIETTKLPLRATYSGSGEDDGEAIFSKQNYVVSQLLTMQEIPADDQEYYMNYCNIPSECDDYSLPRFQTHSPATGEAPITVDDDQVVRLNYNDDFEVTPEGQLSLKNPLDSTAILTAEFILHNGFNGLSNIPTLSMNLVPDNTIITNLKSLLIGIDKIGSINDLNPAVIRVAVDDINADVLYQPGDGDTKYLTNFIEPGDQDGVKYYKYFNIDTLADDVIMDENKAIFIDIDPNSSWTFETVRVTVELELRMNS